MVEKELRESPFTGRTVRQVLITQFWRRSLGDVQVNDIEQRALRFAEEAFELLQLFLTKEQLHHTIEYVYSREPGKVHQELGGVSTTLLVLAQATGNSLEQCEVEEINRIYNKGEEYFRKRNAEKNEAGLCSAKVRESINDSRTVSQPQS